MPDPTLTGLVLARAAMPAKQEAQGDAQRPSPASLYLLTLAPSGRRVQATAVRKIAASLGGEEPERFAWGSVTYDRCVALADAIRSAPGAPATKRRVWSALLGVLRQAERLELMSPVVLAHIERIKTGFGASEETGRALSAGELRALLAACGDSYRGRRDAAMIVLGVLVGLRRAEIVGLDLGDYDRHGSSLRVLGKGNKTRTARLGRSAKARLEAWLDARGPDPGPLFCSAGARRGRRIGYSTVGVCIAARAEAAGVPTFVPHDLRRTFVTEAVERGGGLSEVAALVGHKSIATTKRYAKHRPARLQEVAELLDGFVE